jgi:vacuolar-type H+-ATPase subunit I/STV1
MLRAGIAVVSVVAAVLLYMVIQSNDIKKSQQEVIEEKVVQLAETRIKLDSIMHQLDSKIAEIQELGGDISELQKAKAKLELDKAQLLKNTSEEIASIKATYQAKILNYESLLTVKARNTTLAGREY